MDNTGQMDNPARGIWRRFLLLIPLIAIIIVVSRAYIGSVIGSYTVTSHAAYDEQRFATCDVSMTVPGVVEVESVRQTPKGYARITFRATGDGETMVSFGPSDHNGARSDWILTVKDGAILEGGINFTGWESIHIGVCVVLAVVVALFASALIKLWRMSWYGYEMVACGGGLLFSLFQLAFFTVLLACGSFPSYIGFADNITKTAQWFAYVSAGPIGLLAVLVSISNIALIRHEGFRPINLLGIIASVMLYAVYKLWYTMSDLLYSIPFDAITHIDSLISVAITYGECLLLSTMLCAWLASRHEPKHGVDYIIVLGCGVRADGTPCPLLAGRIERAVGFNKTRMQAGDFTATFVPSGGQGPDEPISEAQSMAAYLVDTCGIDPHRIVLEDRSTTTRENMAFSRGVIEKHAGCDVGEKQVAFSTTNYHVFRGYVCAHQAGMAVEGMGSKTKYYFWPNAFLREFVGLLAAQWKGLLQAYVIISLVYILAEYSLTLT